MDFQLIFYLTHEWSDPRLARVGAQVMQVSMADIARYYGHTIWRPRVMVINARSEMATKVDDSKVIFVIMDTGAVAFTISLSPTLSCAMDLHNYPLDQQVCNLVLESACHTEEDMVLKWKEQKPVDFRFGTNSKKFRLLDISTNKSTLNTESHDTEDEEFGVSVLTASFRMQRETGYYMTTIYLPCSIVVGISWISFWIDSEEAAARVALGITTALTLSTQNNRRDVTFPTASYMKAIEVWMLVCMSFLFCALLESTMVNVATRKTDRCPGLAHKTLTGVVGGRERDSNSGHSQLQKEEVVEEVEDPLGAAGWSPSRIDHLSRILFPTSFLLFNIIYWLYYLVISQPAR